jgi:hypothetical protein
MPPVNYTVSQPQAVTEAFVDLAARAAREGRRPLIFRAARYMLDELAYDPMQFGESREFLPHVQLHMRIAFPRPLGVIFAVHEASKQVFIQRIVLLA